MKNQRLTVKRRPARKRGLTTFFANVARKKQRRHRAATSASPADFEGDVPNLGVGRALMVILAIHVVAIAGIFFHSHWLEEDGGDAATGKEAEPVKNRVVSLPDAEGEKPQIGRENSIYIVGVGDTYAKIAQRFGIDETDLRKANRQFAEVRQGYYLSIPPKKITAVEPPEIAELRDGGRPVRVEPAVTVPGSENPAPAAGGLVPTDAARAADARQAGRDPGPTASSASRYKVQPGDTFWGIAQKYNTSVDTLMALNGIEDPRRLRAGMDLKLPE